MLRIKDLTIVRDHDHYPLITKLSFSLQRGDKLALIGAEGNGKTALLRVICRPEEAASYLRWTGHIDYESKRLGYLAQECPPALRKQTVEELTLPHLADKELYRLADQLFLDSSLLHVPRQLGDLSGGERMKLRLILLMLDRPDIYILDEPVNDLDLQGIQFVEHFIRRAAEPVLFVSHDETLLERTANKILHIEQVWRRTEARITYSGLGFSDYRQQFLEGIERQNRLAAKEEADYRSQLRRHHEIQDKVHRAQENISRQDPSGGRLLKKKMRAVKSTGRRLERQHETQTKRADREDLVGFFLADLPGVAEGKEILRLQLPRLMVGDRVLANNVRLTVRGPERIGITGNNGCGKTTLLRLIEGELSAGNKLKVFFLPQDWQQFCDGKKNALDFLDDQGITGLRQEASNLLGSLNFSWEEMNRPAATLSGGQKIKLAYAKLRLTQAEVLILDEPSRHLSPLSNPVFRAGLALYPGAVISVSHDRVFLREVCSRVLRLTSRGLKEEDPWLYSSRD